MKIEEAKIRFEEIETYTHGFYDDVLIKKRDAKVLLDQLDQPKPVVPQFVADWYESLNRNEDSFRKIFPFVHAPHESTNDTSWIPEDVQIWLSDWDNSFTLSNMHQFGYTVEKEKLYTVEIPNPNGCNLYLIKVDKEVVITSDVMADVFPDKLQLTEAEIRKDFDWAFRWAKEVT